MAKRTRTPHRVRQIIDDTSRRIAIYLRRSTDEDHQPFSLEAQETKLRAFVASQPGDWEIVPSTPTTPPAPAPTAPNSRKRYAPPGPGCSTPCSFTASTGSPAACAT